MLEQFLQKAISAGCIKQTEIKCSRCGEVDHTMMAVGQPATMAGKFTNVSVSIEMKCTCGYEFELSYANGEFKPVQNQTLVAFDGVEYDEFGGDEDFDECDESGHAEDCACFTGREDNLPVRLTALEAPIKRSYNDW